ncbi:hypothetical protein DPMN_021234 [Dreissena polymorpha]|uniref:Uncharacterized protein n=1 Tax=Dreissena polymorpha TaxID=45954 RepID=A0A9D4NKD9_DREPO|nr:hypothetical protein DPMN_021234 [Dreissena polymorpha]
MKGWKNGKRSRYDQLGGRLSDAKAGITSANRNKKQVYIDGGGQHDTGCGNDNLLFNSTDVVEVRLHRR